MDTYTQGSNKASKIITQTFSTSFSSAITLFSKSIQQDIYNIYGLVRIADEIVDTYQGREAAEMLNQLEQEVYKTLTRGFSANIIVHAFCVTATKYGIEKSLIKPFFHSMRMDLTKKTFSQDEYKNYIYGSAEVVGLMCLRVFIDGSEGDYDRLKKGASALGSAFQKVNFLRDLKDDYETRGRYYFPIGSFKGFDERIKTKIIKDIQRDFKTALPALKQLPKTARSATELAYTYYGELLKKLEATSAEGIKKRRISVANSTKLKLFLKTKLTSYGS